MNDVQSTLPVDQLLQYYISQLSNGTGVMALLLFLGLLGLTIAFDRTKWVWLTLIVWVGGFGFVEGDRRYDHADTSLITPLAQIRLYSRLIYFLLMLLLLIPLMKAHKGNRSRVLGGAMLALFAFQLIFSMRVAFSGDFARPMFGAITYLVMFLTIGLGVSCWMQSPRDMRTALRCIFLAACLLIVGSLIQVAVHRQSVLPQGRLMGTTNNPQHIAVTLAMTLPVACFLFVSRMETRAWRTAAIVYLPVALILIIWSGSRTGAMLSIVGMAMFFRARLGLWLRVLAVGGVLLLAGLQTFGDQLAGSAHLFATNNSRAHTWSVLWDSFVQHPLFGTGTGGNAGENSYLSVACSYGILFGVIPLAIALWQLVKGAWRVNGLRAYLGTSSVVPRLVPAWVVTMMLAWMFEAYLVGTTTDFVATLYIILAIMAALHDPNFIYLLQMEEMGPEALATQYAEADAYDQAAYPEPSAYGVDGFMPASQYLPAGAHNDY